MSAMATKKRVLVPLAEGFEEIEAVAIIDVLRRAGVEVVVASLQSTAVRGAHAIEVRADVEFGQVDVASFDMLVLPGGMPGTTNLMEDERVIAAVKTLHAKQRSVAAICAAPMVLARAGVISKVAVTSFPGVRGKLGDADVRAEPRVIKSGTITTSQGAGTAIEFALELVAQFCGAAQAEELRVALIAR
jgi:4-methyl-5(b-hydroxyethyl)-thiazole monophosphate biosynthesis